MNRIQVWLRPMGSATKVRVTSEKNAEWLREQLLQAGAGCGISQLVAGTVFVTFLAYHTPHVDALKLRHIVATLPDVELMLSPA